MKNGAFYKTELNDIERDIIQKWIQTYSAGNSLQFKLDPGFLLNTDENAKHILYFQDDVLVGYMSVDCFNGLDVEVTPIADNPTIFFEMHDCLFENVSKMGKKKLLYIVERNYQLLEKCMNKWGLQPSFSEHRMRLDDEKFKADPYKEVEIRNASEKDKKKLSELDGTAFQQSEDEECLLSDVDIACTKIAMVNQQIIGKVKLFEDKGNVGIYGFVISPSYRGLGYGRAFLSKMIQEEQKKGSSIYLEVETENQVAIHLYLSVGFEIEATFDYYEIPIK